MQAEKGELETSAPPDISWGHITQKRLNKISLSGLDKLKGQDGNLMIFWHTSCREMTNSTSQVTMPAQFTQRNPACRQHGNWNLPIACKHQNSLKSSVINFKMPNHIQGSLISTDTHSNKNRNATAEIWAECCLVTASQIRAWGFRT